jgi:hypothetical protein
MRASPFIVVTMLLILDSDATTISQEAGKRDSMPTEAHSDSNTNRATLAGLVAQNRG